MLRRLVRQVMPEEVLALSVKQSGLQKRCAYSMVVIYSVTAITIGLAKTEMDSAP